MCTLFHHTPGSRRTINPLQAPTHTTWAAHENAGGSGVARFSRPHVRTSTARRRMKSKQTLRVTAKTNVERCIIMYLSANISNATMLHVIRHSISHSSLPRQHCTCCVPWKRKLLPRHQSLRSFQRLLWTSHMLRVRCISSGCR